MFKGIQIPLVALSVLSVGLAAFAGPTTQLRTDYQRDSLDLAGTWQVLAADRDARLFDSATAAKREGWQDRRLPGVLLPDPAEHVKVDTVWARRSFTIDAPLRGDAVFRFAGIRFGVTAWINGTEIGSHPTMGPGALLVPPGTLREGENQIVLRVAGWAGVPRSKSGFPLIPTGAGTQSWGRKTADVDDGIWLEFYRRAHLQSVLAIPDPAHQKVTFRVRLDSSGKLPAARIKATVQDTPGVEAAGAAASFEPGQLSGPCDVVVTMPAALRLWTPQTPHLYSVTVRCELPSGEICDQVSFRFGMRDVRVADGHYQLNGAPLWLRGSNLVTEWEWGGWVTDVKKYIVDEARAMNLNSFRTHTRPLPAAWADVADENGTMILAELPVLFNYGDFKFTPEEWEVWHRNCMLDAEGWITARWNHPSVIMWVLSNESREDQWEAGPFRDAVLALDPTRPTMRTGDRVKENRDMHTCSNFDMPPEGAAIREFAGAARGKPADQTLTNSEYMNIFGTWQTLSTHWVGRADREAYDRVFAECAAEHTEAMRRLKFDGILPYMYAGWTGMRGNSWREDFPTPMAAALHSSMAPVLASVDLFDRNFAAGREMKTPLHLINELHQTCAARVDVYVTEKDPLFVPDKPALDASIFRDSFTRTLKADSVAVEELKWSVPNKPGTYYLAVVLTRDGDRPVVSQRTVRSVATQDDALRGRKLVVLGDEDEEIGKCLKAAGATVATSIAAPIVADAIVVCDSGKLADADLAAAPAVLQYLRSGGRLVILNQSRWRWKELVEFSIDSKAGRTSRAFVCEKAADPMLDDISPDCLQRWNGLPGVIADAALGGAILKSARPLLWTYKPERIVAASIPVGDGEVLVNLLHMRGRLDRDSATYDPVAERMMCNMLSARRPATRASGE